MRIGEPYALQGCGALSRALPLWKWRRPDGLASMVRDLISLRKTLILCHSCEGKMPRKWESRYNYALVKGFHAGGTACDYCPQNGLQPAVNMWCAVDGLYHQEMEKARKSVEETQARERAAYERDRTYFVGVR